MAREAITMSNAIDIKDDVNVTHEGEYVGKRSITTKIGPQVIWEFVDEDGKKFGIFGFTTLNAAMDNATIGDYIYVTYKGTKNMQTRFGVKDVHQVLVEREVVDGSTPGTAPAPAGPDNEALLSRILLTLKEKTFANPTEKVDLLRKTFGCESWMDVCKLPADRLEAGIMALNDDLPF